jgi:hypothetical protein
MSSTVPIHPNHLDAEEQRRRQVELNKPVIALLESWLDDESESPGEQRENLIKLMRAIDEDRAGGRLLFRKYLQRLES